MSVSPNRLRNLATFKVGVDLQARLSHAEDIVRRQSDALNAAADEIEGLQAMVVTLTQELEHCKSAGKTA